MPRYTVLHSKFETTSSVHNFQLTWDELKKRNGIDMTSKTELQLQCPQFYNARLTSVPQHCVTAFAGNLMQPLHGMLCVSACDDNGAML